MSENNNVNLKVEKEDYVEISDPNVAAVGQLHEPQVIPDSKMDVFKDAGSLSWFQNVQCGSINYVEYHNSELITYSIKAENNADDETVLNVGSDSSDLGGIQTKDHSGESGMKSEGREELAKDEVELSGDGIKRESDEGEEKEDDRVCCHHCGEERNTVDEIKEHIYNKHLSMFVDEEREVDNSESTKMYRKCNFSEKTFMYKSILNRHVRVLKSKKSVKSVSSVCKTLHSQNVKDHFSGYGKDGYDCQYCDYSCTQERQLKEHMCKHTAERPYKCQHCESRFYKKTHLQRHTRKHTGERPYKCQYCELSFSQKSTLQAHTRRHTGERPYLCQICGLGYSQRSSLKAHKRRHTGERPYLCQICGLGYSQSRALQAHMHKHAGERPFKSQH